MKNELGNLIREKRKQAKLTQRQLANRLNTTDKTISKWETGEGLPDVFTMAQICDALSISFDEFFNLTTSFDEKYKSEVNRRMAELEDNNRTLQLQIETLKSQNDAFVQEARAEREKTRNRYDRIITNLRKALLVLMALVIVTAAGSMYVSYLKNSAVPLKLKTDNVQVKVAYGSNLDRYSSYVEISVKNQKLSLDRLPGKGKMISLKTGEGEVDCLIFTVSTTRFDRLFAPRQKNYVMVYSNEWYVPKNPDTSQFEIRYVIYYHDDLETLPSEDTLEELINNPEITVIWDSSQQ